MERMPTEFTLEEVLKGKATSIKGKDYLPTRGYIEPFLERVQKLTSDIRVHVKLPDQITYNKNGDIDTADLTFNRVWLEAVLPNEYSVDNHKETINMLYGLDTRKPIIKFFRTGLNMACLNMCVFNPSYIRVSELSPDKPVDYSPVKTLVEATDSLGIFIKTLKNTEFNTSESNINISLGYWVRQAITEFEDNGFGKIKLATSEVIASYKRMFEDSKSDYYIGINGEASMFDVYNSFTEGISNDNNKDIMNKFEKCVLLKKILNL